jgi:hypothetical protein
MFVPTDETTLQRTRDERLRVAERIAAVVHAVRFRDGTIPTSGRFSPHCLEPAAQQRLRASDCVIADGLVLLAFISSSASQLSDSLNSNGFVASP